MEAKNQQKRVKRTRQTLANALVELMIEKGYDDITVQEILDRASLGRSTFYAHFGSKEQLLLSSLESLRSGMSNQWKALLQSKEIKPGELGFALPFLQHIENMQHLYRAFTRGESGVILDRQLRKMFVELVKADIAASDDRRWAGASLDAAAQAVAGALMALVAWWMDSKTGLSAEQVNDVFTRIARNGLQR